MKNKYSELKVQQGKDIRDLNKIGKRIKWVREQLKIPQNEVARQTGLSQSSYSGRENGVRAIYIEEYLVLAQYFNDHWNQKYETNHPTFEDQKIKSITTEWIMFGILH